MRRDSTEPPTRSGAGPTGDGPGSRYARLWESGRPDLDAFLAEAGPLSPDDLAAVLRADQRGRWEAGERVPAEDYLRRLPGEPDAEVAVDLIFQEYLLRERRGEAPETEEFAGRFPQYAAVLRDQIDLHRALASDPTGTATHGPGGDTADAPTSGGPAAEPPPLSETFGRYRILRALGRGGMGAVYLAHDTLLDRQVALKVPHFGPGEPSAAERFRREARAAGALHHPNLCPVYDVGRVGGRDYLTMRFIPGESLAARLRRTGPPPERDAARLAAQVAGALEAAHQGGVVHRDLKPGNILFDERGEPVVTDFGLARRVGPDDPRLTESGAVIGTPAYMPPEQIGCDPDALDPRCDVYSLGVVLYELLAGRLPYTGPSGEVLRKVLAGDPEPPSRHRPGLDPELEAVCLCAMAKEPGERFASMAEFAAALDACAAGESLPPSARTRLAARAAAARRGARGRRAALAAAVLGLVALAAWHLTRPDPVPQGAADPFAAGSVWEGVFYFAPEKAPKKIPAKLTVTQRTGRQFRAEYDTERGKYRWEAAGTAADGKVRWELVKALNHEAETTGATGQAKVEGDYKDGTLTAMYSDHDSHARMELRRHDGR